MRRLNALPGLENPTSEIMFSWMLNKARTQRPQLCGVERFEIHGCGVGINAA